jgi:hypothetical protein
MLTHLEDSQSTTPMWSWKKISAWFVGVIALLLTGIVVWDEKPQPFPELMQHRRSMPPVADNGYFILTKAWTPWPKVDGKIGQKRSNMELGRVAWDNTVADALNPTGRDLSADLAKALAAPEWMVPIESPIGNEDSPIPYGFTALRAAAFQRLLEGKAGPALDLIFQLRQLSRRQISGSNDGQGFQKGCTLDMNAATLTAQLMVMIPQDEATLMRLAECWTEDHLSQEDFGPVAAGHSEYFEAWLDAGADGLYLTSWRKWHYNLTTKRNQSVNRMNQILSVISTRSLATASERSLSLYQETDQLQNSIHGGMRLMDPNCGGNTVMMMAFTGFNYGAGVFLNAPRQKLFAARAARVAVALKRWQLAHGGNLPDQLAVLVPGFLTSVPPDPWNGKPLQWDPVRSILSAVGETWKSPLPDPESFGMSGLGLSQWDRIHYSLDRTNAAPPPLPAPPVPVKKKR